MEHLKPVNSANSSVLLIGRRKEEEKWTGSYCVGSAPYHTRGFYRRQKNRGRVWGLHIPIPHLHLSLRKTSTIQNTITTTTITTIATAVATTKSAV